jgi:glyoxylase-like metal-dependent hydrolase (beta-lactamase superfamily II)
LQGLPLPPRADRRAALRFGMPWARDAFTAPLGPELRDGEPLPGFPGWTVLETPGHADDAIALHCADAGLLVCGDTVRNFLGGEWNPLVVDRAAFAETRRRLRALPVHAVLPGHGPVLEGRDVIGSLREVPAWLP